MYLRAIALLAVFTVSGCNQTTTELVGEDQVQVTRVLKSDENDFQQLHADARNLCKQNGFSEAYINDGVKILPSADGNIKVGALAKCVTQEERVAMGDKPKIAPTSPELIESNKKQVAENLKKFSDGQVGIALLAAVAGGVSGNTALGGATIDQTARNIQVAQARVDRLFASGSGLIGSNPVSNSQQSGKTQLVSVAIGSSVYPNITLSERCGLPEANATTANRRAWFDEAKKSGKYNSTFSSDAQLEAEARRVGKPDGFISFCEGARAQVWAFLPSLNQAIRASIRFRNSSDRVMQTICTPVDSATDDTRCTAVAIIRAIYDVSKVCHIACKKGF